MKETTTTIVTTEVTRRAPRKKTIARSDHIIKDGQVMITETYAPANWNGEGQGITRISQSDAKKKIKSGLTNSMGCSENTGKLCLASSLFHLAAIRNGICDIAAHPELSLLDKDDCERLQIIAVQLNEFIPILRDIMTKRVTLFANYQYPIL